MRGNHCIHFKASGPSECECSLFEYVLLLARNAIGSNFVTIGPPTTDECMLWVVFRYCLNCAWDFYCRVLDL